MKVKYYNNSTILVEHKGTKILVDPWLFGQTNIGSWSMYPKLDIDWSEFDDLDYIHITHIHTDHLHVPTLQKLSNNIPVLIHEWDDKFVKMNLERIGKRVIELEHGKKFNLGDDFDFHLYAADGCNPEVCFKFFGCGKLTPKSKSVGIDTFSVMSTSEKTFVQTNDCPHPIMKNTIQVIKDKFKEIDLLFTLYTGAGAYPQQMSNYTDDEKINKYGVHKRDKFLDYGINFLKDFKPKYYMPYAGTYTLTGRFAHLDKLKGTPTRVEALKIYKKNYSDGEGFLLNGCESYDLETNKVSSPYVETDLKEKQKYIDEVLSKIKMPYEYDEDVSLEQMIEFIPKAFERFSNKRKEMNYSTNTNLYIYLVDNKMLKIPFDGNHYSIIDEKDFNDDNYVTYKMHPKLLYGILKGPKYYHMNNADGGSHIEWYRKPDTYQSQMYHIMNYFHA